ncbi:hypothetical protein KP509_35G041100 [Ceratopteris richardii]|uniref:Ataxin-2 C-terminal domain-containing protein n=1 Tax=Ceratopteris richardii TaxID=49495 RepID=A0A8T2QG79_CERRI|nr:hypothetical protein KP509_35G041100 [Ceratopteris richardii]
MAVQSRPLSYLNPDAPLFVPAAFLQAEDFSPEWWRLVDTCPAFRDYWLRDRYDCWSDEEDLTAEDIDELDHVYDLTELCAHFVDLEMEEEALRLTGDEPLIASDPFDSEDSTLEADLKSLNIH